MNVSQQADAAFTDSLRTEDPERYARLLKNIRRDSPLTAMDESQALTNFMLGLPTGGFRFAVYKRPEILNEALYHGTTEEYVRTILSVANSDNDGFVAEELVPLVAPSDVGSNEPKPRGGRPRLQITQRARKDRRRQQKREHMRRVRSAEPQAA